MKFVINLMTLFSIMFNNLCQAEAMLRFQPQINASAQRLGDVLLIEHDKEKWSNLPLASHPVAGEVITKDKILGWMSQRLGKFTASWQGKTQVRVSLPIQSSGLALQDKARMALIKKLGRHYTRFTIEPMSRLKDSNHPIDDFTAIATVSFPVAKRVCVWLNNGKQHIPVWFRVRAYTNVWVANHTSSYNTLVLKEAFSWKERNIAGLIGMPAKSLPENAWLKSSIETDKILLASHTKNAPAIIHGQTIKVHFISPRINLVMDAVALADGNIGQMIRVKNNRNQKSFDALVTGFQTARVNT